MSALGKRKALFDDDEEEKQPAPPSKRQKKEKEKEQQKKAKASSSSSSDSEDNIIDSELKVNSKFAKEYESKKRHEELSKMKDAGIALSDEESSESSDSVEEDEEGELAPYVADSFMTVLPMIAAKNPDIYQSTKKFFPDEIEVDESKKPKEVKVTFKDAVRKQIMEKFEKGTDESSSSSSSEELDSDAEREEETDLTVVEAQKRAKSAFMKAASGADDDADGFGGLNKRVRTADEEETFENEYLAFIAKQENQEKESKLKKDSQKEGFGKLTTFWLDKSLSPDERFLRDYVLNKRWMDKPGRKSSKQKGKVQDEDEADDGQTVDKDEDEDYLDKQDEFEAKYNFRFEQTESPDIVSFPRHVPESVRAEPNKRKEQRDKKKERKDLEKQQREDEKRRLLRLKQEEITQRAQQLMEAAGLYGIDASKFDLDGDFDPAKYDAAMKTLFDDDYYAAADDDKPNFGDEMETEPSVADKFIGNEEAKEEAASTAIPKGEKPDIAEIEKDEKYAKLVDEYYKLDYEDVAGGVPVKFRYTQVKPYSYGLSPMDILKKEDSELDRVVSIRKLQPYRDDQGIPHSKRRKDKIKDKAVEQKRAEEEALKNNKRKQRRNRKKVGLPPKPE